MDAQRFSSRIFTAILALLAAGILVLTSLSGQVPTLAFSEQEGQNQKNQSRVLGFSWITERVDAPKMIEDIGPRSFALDSNGNPHFAYGGDFLYYAWYDSLTWHVEPVDTSGGVGRYASLGLDATDRPRISYYDLVNRNLKYAHYDGSSWQIEIIDSEFGIKISGYSALALDSMGYPYVAYYDDTNGDLKFARHDGIAWQIETVDSEGDVGMRASLIFDAANLPHITYKDYTNGNLKYAHFDGTTWQIETVDSGGSVGGGSSLDLGADNHPHVSYCLTTS